MVATKTRLRMPRAATPPKQNVQEGVLSRVWARSTDLCIDRAHGAYVEDTSGNTFLDFASGIAVTNTGHCHPHVVSAIKQQAGKMLHCQINNYHNEALHELTRRVGAHLPRGVNHIYYDNTGTAAVEASVKMARQATKRPNLITLLGGMHGRSGMCSAMTSNSASRNPLYYPLPSGVYNAPFPTSFNWGCTAEEAAERALTGLRQVLKAQVRPEQVAAIIFEPILGEGGFIPCGTQFYQGVREICNAHGILLIMDEIQSGYGRSGRMWAHQHFSTETTHPDIIVSSKGIASGMPLSMVAATKEVMDTFTPGTHGGTFNGNPVSLAAAIATLDVFEKEGLVKNSKTRGAALKAMLQDIFAKHMPSGDVRGEGLMIGLECTDTKGHASPGAANYIKKHCLQKSNLILMTPTGFDANILRVMPPLTITDAEGITAAGKIEHAMSDWKKGVSLA